MWIQRVISPTLTRLVGQRPAVVMTGARQTGKTSLVRRLFPEHRYVSLDLPAKAAQAEQEPAAFLRQHPPPLIVDEVQYAGGLFRHLKSDIDGHRGNWGRYVLTGSQKVALMKEVSDSLAGRVAVIELLPLELAEVHSVQPDLPLEQLVVRGGYPELYEQPGLDASEFYAGYLATYLERDVRSMLRVGSLRDFERFIRACALRSGQLLNKSDLARDVGISPSTANEWLSVLQAINQIGLLEPWFANRTRSMTKSPKLYLTDTGLLCFLLGIRDEDELARSPYRGAVWETFVFSELYKRYGRVFPRTPFYFWRDRGREVDFVLHRGGHFEALEVKWAEHPDERDGKGFAALEALLSPQGCLDARRIICRTEESFQITPSVRAVCATDAWFDGDARPDMKTGNAQGRGCP